MMDKISTIVTLVAAISLRTHWTNPTGRGQARARSPNPGVVAPRFYSTESD
jgi:hypothetical protein